MKKNTTLPRKIFHKIFRGGYCDNEEFIAYLRKCGIKIGSHCTFYDCNKVSIDTQNPCMLEIGDYVRITDGVQILTHDYSFSVLCSVEGDIVGSVEKVTIGNNVFIGRNAIILKGVQIIVYMRVIRQKGFAPLRICTKKEKIRCLKMRSKLYIVIIKGMEKLQNNQF